MTVYRPTTYSLGTWYENPEYAYDTNTATSAYATASDIQTRECIYHGFASFAVSGNITLVVDWSATLNAAGYTSDGEEAIASAYIMVSVNSGSTWTSLDFATEGMSFPGDRARDAYEYTISGLTNLSALRVKVGASGSAVTDINTSKIYKASATINIYDITITLNSHNVVLSHTPPGTSAGKRIYASNMWNATAGTYSVPSTTVSAIFTQDGANGYWYLESFS